MKKLVKSGSPSFSPDSQTLVTTSASAIHVWEVSSGVLKSKFKALSNLSHAAVSPDGERVAVKSTSGRIAVYDFAGELLLDCKNQKEGEGCPPVWTPDGKYLIDGSWAKWLRRRRTDTGEVVAEGAAKMVGAVALLPDGRLAVSHTQQGDPPSEHLEYRDPETLDLLKDSLKFEGYRLDSGVSPTGKYLWATRNWPRGLFFDLFDQSLNLVGTVPIADDGSGNAIAFAADEREMTLGVRKNLITRLSVSDLKEMESYEVPYPSEAAYSANGKHLALGGWSVGWIVDLF